MQNGFLISFEGGEGSGKSVQTQLLAEKLRQEGYTPLVLREPGGTKIGEAIRQVVLDSKFSEMALTTEVFLFQAQRAQLYHEVILPALQNGQLVVIDRTRDSSLVYQGIVRGFGKDLIEQLNTISTQKTYPNVTFLLDVPVELGLKRRGATGQTDRIDNEKTEFHQKVREAYLEVAKVNEQKRWWIIDASQSIELIADQVWQKLAVEFSKNL